MGFLSHGVKIFVCYSRVEFYFAEDLALALGRYGLEVWFDVHRLRPADDWDREIHEAVRTADCVVLVASRSAVASPHVAAELELARQLCIPVIVVLAEHVDLPDAVAHAAQIDLCVGFEPKVRWLAAALLAGDYDKLTSTVHSSRSDRPGVVQVLSTLLYGTTLVWGVGSLWGLALILSESQGWSSALLMVPVALFAAFCGWLQTAFSRRRRGSATLLGLTFAYFVSFGAIVACGLVIALIVSGVPIGLQVPTAAIVSAVPIRLQVPTAAIVTCFVAWLSAGTWALQSAAIYRWLPTSDAPRWMRRRMLARRRYRAAAQPRLCAVSITYDIRCDELDGSVERALDRALHAAGHRRADSVRADRVIVLLSDLTPIDWLTQTLGQVDARAILVISTPISLAALHHIERYQWVDYRRCDRRALKRLAASIGGGATAVGAEVVPETFDRSVLPLAVIAACALCILTAAAGLARALAGFAGADFITASGARPPLEQSLGALSIGLASLWIAMALVARRIPLRYFLAGYLSVHVVTVAMPWLASHATVLGVGALPLAVGDVVVLGVCSKTLSDLLQ